MTVTIIVGDALAELRKRQSDSVHCCVSSPPYWGLRDYGVPPSVWGGEQGCEHLWGDEVLDRSRRSPGTQGGSLTGDGRYQSEACRFEIRSNFCTKCGAWRGAFGLEPTPEMFIDHLVEVFEEVRRVLRPDGTLWLNLGDSYATGAGRVGNHPGGGEQGSAWAGRPNAGETSWAGHRGKKTRANRSGANQGKHAEAMGPMTQPNRMPQAGLKPKDLVGIPWMAAFALRRAGWWLRGDNIWAKPNPMPESTTDRCTKAHEYVFLLAKSETYFYDHVAIAEGASENTRPRRASNYVPSGWATDAERKHDEPEGNFRQKRKLARHGDGIKNNDSFDDAMVSMPSTRNKRSVWTVDEDEYDQFLRWKVEQERFKPDVWRVATAPFPEAHFATFPPALIEPCIKAGTSERGCCPACLAPWERVTGKVDTGKKQKMPDGMATHAGGHETIHRDGREKGASDNPVLETVTLGWWPGCRCEGLDAALPTYPAKPSRAELDDEIRYKRNVAQWIVKCEAVNDRIRDMCAVVAGRKTVPAVVVDPFGGAGTTGLVADRLQRDALLIELSDTYAAMARGRIDEDAGLFARAAE